MRATVKYNDASSPPLKLGKGEGGGYKIDEKNKTKQPTALLSLEEALSTHPVNAVL